VQEGTAYPGALQRERLHHWPRGEGREEGDIPVAKATTSGRPRADLIAFQKAQVFLVGVIELLFLPKFVLYIRLREGKLWLPAMTLYSGMRIPRKVQLLFKRARMTMALRGSTWDVPSLRLARLRLRMSRRIHSWACWAGAPTLAQITSIRGCPGLPDMAGGRAGGPGRHRMTNRVAAALWGLADRRTVRLCMPAQSGLPVPESMVWAERA